MIKRVIVTILLFVTIIRAFEIDPFNPKASLVETLAQTVCR